MQRANNKKEGLEIGPTTQVVPTRSRRNSDAITGNRQGSTAVPVATGNGPPVDRRCGALVDRGRPRPSRVHLRPTAVGTFAFLDNFWVRSGWTGLSWVRLG